MSEFNVLGHSAAEILLFNAMSEMTDKGDILALFNLTANGDASKADVKVFVNGVEVDFESSLKKGLEKVLQEYEENVRKEARELIKEKSEALNNLLNELDNYHAGLEKCLDKLNEE